MKEKIPRRSTHCVLGGELFTPGTEYMSQLIATENGWQRADYCLTCWEKTPKKKEGAYWRGRIPAKKEKKKTPDERALELFRKEEDPKLLSVLALYLQRRDQIIRRSEEKKRLLFEIPETGEIIPVPKMHLSPEEGRKIGEQLVKLLNAPPK